ncbi:MAG TPA: response regulator [Candidatus Lokiarchaeia archaeon]|nr:response regulator [Candidatus Lokiarchaeia archaeon]
MYKVLIVEDNEKNLKLFKLILDSNGYQSLIARNGEEGIQIAEDQNPDLILMDIQMPVLGGVDALRAIRTNEKTKTIPVIATTAYAMKGDKELFLDFGFEAYISKPIRIKEFLDTIESVLNGAGSEQKE